MLLFKLQNVSFRDIIQYLDFDMEKGTTVFVSGKSGCGKSTLLKMLNGTISADNGSILYLGKDISQCDTIQLRREVLLCGQAVYLLDGSIRDNFAGFYAYRNLPAPDDATITRYLSVCAADFALDSKCVTMSGGERQRVFAAVCLSFMPKVLLLDEPTSALDERTSEAFFDGVTSFCRENSISIVVVSHNTNLAGRYADKIIDMESRK